MRSPPCLFELASAGQFAGQFDHHTPAPYVEKAFRKYLECGIFAHGFARARCDDYGHDFLVAFSCKGRGVCPSCNTRRMAEAAAHLCDHVCPRVPVRQWVLSVPKRLRYYLQRDKGALNAALRIFLRVVQQSLQTHCPGAAKADPASLHLGAVAFIHRFGSSLNTHVHFHVCVVDGVFEALPDGVTFHAATGLDEAAFRSMPGCASQQLTAQGWSDCCATVRGPHLPWIASSSAALIWSTAVAKGHAEPLQSDKYSGELVLTPLELIDRIAQLVSPPRTHRHRYYGALAPNSPLRSVVAAMAMAMAMAQVAVPVAACSPVTEDGNADVDAPMLARPSQQSRSAGLV
jgi:hypothetical protein